LKLPLSKTALGCALFCALFATVDLSAQMKAGKSMDNARDYRVLGADKKRVAIVNAKGEIEWEAPNNDAREIHDIQLLPDGAVLFQTSYTTVVEMNRDKQVVWRYEAKPKEGYTGRVEIHSYQRLKNGLTMIAESGNARLVEVDKKGQIVKEIALTVDNPNAHRDTRMVRKLDNGHYLVCHEGDGKLREYDGAGKVVWTYEMDMNGRPASPGHGPEGHGVAVFGAIRMPNGNTMIAGGNNNRVLEVTPAGKVVWSVDQKELPGVTLAWVTTLQLLPNGNLIIGNTHAGPDNPQLIEVTRDKKVVWTFKDFTNFGNNLVAAQALVKGKVIR
jgi:Mal s 1 allergenic protein-like